MTPADFDAWLKHMGLSERRAAELLGVNPASIGAWRRGINYKTGQPLQADRRTALACSALAAGLDEWRADALMYQQAWPR
jgi:hypothetical protein